MIEKMFYTGDGRLMTFDDVVKTISHYILSNLNDDYEITIGTDSQNSDKTKVVEVIAVRRIGKGGIFFYHIDYIEQLRDIRTKIYEETMRSLNNAHNFLDKIKEVIANESPRIDFEQLKIHLVVHCDIGKTMNCKTRSLVKEIVGWVETEGFDCAIKPDSYAASGIANKFSKFH